MAVTGLLALLDDIGTMAKVAAQKTVGISGDDLAVNSKALSGGGITPDRELPIVYKVAKGSLKNKFFYLIPGALVLSAIAPWAIMPAMMLGGAFLSYEGVEKILHKDKGGTQEPQERDVKKLEEQKIASAIRTDVILSAEIVVVTLGAVAASPFLVQLGVLAAVGVAMTAGIYGVVGGIVKLDDIGMHMAKKQGDGLFAKAERAIGRGLVKAMPHVMKGISVVGTAAMFMVGGGMLLHGIPAAEHLVTGAASLISNTPLLAGAVEAVAGIAAGLAAGFAAVPVMKVLEKPLEKIAEIGGKVFGKIKETVKARFFKPKAPANDNKQAAIPEQAPAPLPEAGSLSAAHQAAVQKPDVLPPEVKPEAPEFKDFEDKLKRNFGR